MEYIKKFETTAQYNTYKASKDFIVPNVSLCEDDLTKVYYNPWFDPYAGHEYIEIAGRKWATMNVGANSVTDTGLYFQWGDTQGYTAEQVGEGEGQKFFGWADYKYATDPQEYSATMSKYNSTDNLSELEESDDALLANWGGKWRVPDPMDYYDLLAGTNYSLTDDYKGSGVAGIVCVDKTDSSKELFFPSCGMAFRGSVSGTDGIYGTSDRPSSQADEHRNYTFFFRTNQIEYTDYTNRCNGLPLRGIIKE